jgi:hypothetical protein
MLLHKSKNISVSKYLVTEKLTSDFKDSATMRNNVRSSACALDYNHDDEHIHIYIYIQKYSHLHSYVLFNKNK